MEVNERVMSDERWAQTFQMMTTSALYKLNPVFTGLELRTAIQSSLESFNKTKVYILSLNVYICSWPVSHY